MLADVLLAYNFAILFGNVMLRLLWLPVREGGFKIVELNFESSFELLTFYSMTLLFST